MLLRDQGGLAVRLTKIMGGLETSQCPVSSRTGWIVDTGGRRGESWYGLLGW
jgi:hypothetical protein